QQYLKSLATNGEMAGQGPTPPTGLSSCRNCRRLLGHRRGRLRSHRLRPHQPQQLPQFDVDLASDIGVVFQELLGVLPALPDSLALVAEPRPALLDEVIRHSEIDQVAFF